MRFDSNLQSSKHGLCLPWLKIGSQLDALLLQDDAMVTRTAMAEKYQNPQDYEDDFM